MLKILQTLLYGLLALIYILLIISIFQVYKDTEINPFQNNFGFEEKKNFFLYNKVYRSYYSEKVSRFNYGSRHTKIRRCFWTKFGLNSYLLFFNFNFYDDFIL